MDWLFFHNVHDCQSVALLTQTQNTIAAMPEGERPNLIVYDVFNGGEPFEPPSGITLSHLPYLVNKQFTHDVSTSYPVGDLLLHFTCSDWQGAPLVDEAPTVFVVINGAQYSLTPENGTFEIKITCNEPTNLNIDLIADGYYHLFVATEVV